MDADEHFAVSRCRRTDGAGLDERLNAARVVASDPVTREHAVSLGSGVRRVKGEREAGVPGGGCRVRSSRSGPPAWSSRLLCPSVPGATRPGCGRDVRPGLARVRPRRLRAPGARRSAATAGAAIRWPAWTADLSAGSSSVRSGDAVVTRPTGVRQRARSMAPGCRRRTSQIADSCEPATHRDRALSRSY